MLPKTNRLPVIFSSKKMGLFRVSKELQLRVYNHGELCASPHTAKEGECSNTKEKEAGRAVVN